VVNWSSAQLVLANPPTGGPNQGKARKNKETKDSSRKSKIPFTTMVQRQKVRRNLGILCKANKAW